MFGILILTIIIKQMKLKYIKFYANLMYLFQADIVFRFKISLPHSDIGIQQKQAIVIFKIQEFIKPFFCMANKKLCKCKLKTLCNFLCCQNLSHITYCCSSIENNNLRCPLRGPLGKAISMLVIGNIKLTTVIIGETIHLLRVSLIQYIIWDSNELYKVYKFMSKHLKFLILKL